MLSRFHNMGSCAGSWTDHLARLFAYNGLETSQHLAAVGIAGFGVGFVGAG